MSCVEFSVQLFKLDSFVKSWIRLGKRSAEETRCPKRDIEEFEHSHQHLWAH